MSNVEKVLEQELLAELARLDAEIAHAEQGSEEMDDACRRKMAVLDKMNDYVKTKTGLETEQIRNGVTWKRVAFDMAKILVPLAITIAHYNYAQLKVFEFEEHGRITSVPGRELHLPKIFSKF